MTHVKPTQEELEENIRKTQEALESTNDEPDEDEEDNQDTTTDDKAEETEDTKEDETSDDSEENKEDTVLDDTEDDKSDDKEDVDYKEKFSQSSREAQKINAKNKKIVNAINDIESIPEPTDEELQAEYGEDYELATNIEKITLKEALVSKRWREGISKAQEEAKKIEKWEESVTEYIENPETLIKTPELEGKENAFKEFATREEHSSVPFAVLVPAFLHEQSTKVVKHKGKMMETGTGGPSSKGDQPSNKLTPAEAAKLMTTNYPLYKKKLLAGQISNI